MSWGGKREGAGAKPGRRRKVHQVRLHPEEAELLADRFPGYNKAQLLRALGGDRAALRLLSTRIARVLEESGES